MIKQGATREGWWNAFIPHPAHFYSCPVLEQVGVVLGGRFNYKQNITKSIRQFFGRNFCGTYKINNPTENASNRIKDNIFCETSILFNDMFLLTKVNKSIFFFDFSISRSKLFKTASQQYL